MHSFVTWCLQQSISLMDVRYLARHISIDTTASYSHRESGHLRSVVDRIKFFGRGT